MSAKPRAADPSIFMTQSNWHLLSTHTRSFAAIAALGKFPVFVCGTAVLAGLVLLVLEPTDDQVFLLWVSALLIGGGLLWLLPLFLAYVRTVKAVAVYEEGLTTTRHGRDETQSWDNIREVYRRDNVS